MPSSILTSIWRRMITTPPVNSAPASGSAWARNAWDYQDVTRDQFHALCENRNPGTGERLTQRTQKEGQRRVFYDFTCSSPKSVSVLAVTLADERLVVAHEESAKGISTAEVREQQWSQLSAAERESL